MVVLSWVTALCRIGDARDGSSPPLPLYAASWRHWTDIRLYSCYIQPLLDGQHLTLQLLADNLRSNRHTGWASSKIPLPSYPSKVLSTPGAQLSLWNQTPEPCLVLRWCWKSSAGTWVACNGPPSAAGLLLGPECPLMFWCCPIRGGLMDWESKETLARQKQLLLL